MDSQSYDAMTAAHTNPPLPGESLGALGRYADVQPTFMVPGLALAALGAYHLYTTSDGDKMDYAALFGAWVAGGLLTHSIN